MTCGESVEEGRREEEERFLTFVRNDGGRDEERTKKRREISLCASRPFRRSERKGKKRRLAPFEMTGKKGDVRRRGQRRVVGVGADLEGEA
jgi:hypothetical protein